MVQQMANSSGVDTVDDGASLSGLAEQFGSGQNSQMCRQSVVWYAELVGNVTGSEPFRTFPNQQTKDLQTAGLGQGGKCVHD